MSYHMRGCFGTVLSATLSTNKLLYVEAFLISGGGQVDDAVFISRFFE